MGKRLDANTKITSTSDISVGDLVEAVAERLEKGSSRKAIEKVVKETVRPCALGRVPTVVAGRCADGDGAGDGNTKRFAGGQLRAAGSVSAYAPGGRGCDGLSGADASPAGRQVDHDADGVPQPTGRMATDEDRISRRTGAGVRDGGDPKIAITSKWYNAVLQNGEVWTPYTSRRFLPAQYLGLMLQGKGNVDAAIARRYSLRDCWRLLDTELEKLIFMDTHWHTAYVERCRFLPVKTVQEIFREYLNALEENINDRSKCTYSKQSGEYRRRIQGEGRVVLWTKAETSKTGDNGAVTETTSIEPTRWLEDLNDKIVEARAKLPRCASYAKLLDLLRNCMPQVSMGTFKDSEGCTRYWLPKAWKAAFKKQGAYYTLKSLVVNCHVRFTTEDGDWRRKVTKASESARDGLDRLAALSAEDVPAFVVHAILKKSIEASRFDIAKFLRSVSR